MLSTVGRRSLSLAPHRLFSSAPTPAIKRVGVIGLGLMGHGIAQVSAQAGISVVAVETEQKFVDKGMGMIQKSLAKVANKLAASGKITKEAEGGFVSDILARITATTDKGALADCDMVIEAIVENIAVKTPLYQELSKITRPNTILASNTSSLSIEKIAAAATNPERVIGLHFFNPVQMMQLVEIVQTAKNDSGVISAAKGFVKTIGKQGVVCQDTPGFIVNRLLVPNLAQAISLLDRGVASVEDIDTAMRLGAGLPMGPLTLADYVGLDTCLFILKGWISEFPDEKAFFIPASLKQKVKEGKLGRKTGEGYYKWEGDKVVGPASK